MPLATIEKWHEEGVVTYLGETDDVREFILAADCVVLPTFYREGVRGHLSRLPQWGVRSLLQMSLVAAKLFVMEKMDFLSFLETCKTLADKMKKFAALARN